MHGSIRSCPLQKLFFAPKIPLLLPKMWLAGCLVAEACMHRIERSSVRRKFLSFWSRSGTRKFQNTTDQSNRTISATRFSASSIPHSRACITPDTRHPYNSSYSSIHQKCPHRNSLCFVCGFGLKKIKSNYQRR